MNYLMAFLHSGYMLARYHVQEGSGVAALGGRSFSEVLAFLNI